MRLRRRVCAVLGVALLAASCGQSEDDANGGVNDTQSASEDIDDDVGATDGMVDDDADVGDVAAEREDDADTADSNEEDNAAIRGPEPESEADDADGADAPDIGPLGTEADTLDETIVRIDTDDGEVRVDVKIAVESPDRQRGLMNVEELADGTGMIFIFEEERRGGFWMKNTLIPLDIAYANEDGEILAILSMEPCEADPCPAYDSGEEYLTALEVPQGWFEQVGVSEGDRLRWDDPVSVTD